MPRSILILAALALAAMSLIAGCGGSDDKATATTAATTEKTLPPPTTKAAFLKRAEPICAEAKEARYNAAVKYREEHAKELKALEPVPAEEKIIRAVVLPGIAKQLEELEAIGIPAGQEKKLGAIFVAFNEGLKGAHKNPYAIELENPSENPFLKVDNLIRSYGFHECRNVP